MNITQEINKIEDQISLIEQRLTNVRKTVGGEILHEDVLVDYLNTPTYDNLHQFINNTCSAMRISGGAVTPSGANEIDVASGTGILKITDSEIGANIQFDWAAEANIIIAADETTWVGIEYNGGTPRVKTDTDLSNFNFNTDFILARAYNHGGVVCVLNAGSYYSNFQHKVCYRLFDIEGFTRAAGAVIADEGNLDFSITEGRFYCGTTPFTFPLWDCSGADRFTYWYRDGIGGWTTAGAQADIDDARYDDGTLPLGNLSANRYGVHWVYICHDGNVHAQYGQGDYKLAEAEAALVPIGPDFFAENAKLVGKIIVKVGAGVLTDVLSAFEEVFIGAAASIHNELGGLQGGQADQYYHLNATEHPYVSGANAQSLLTTASPTFVDLTLSGTFIGPLTITQNADTIVLSHDGTDAFIKWNDGVLNFQTTEVNGVTTIHLHPAGISEESEILFYDKDGIRLAISVAADAAFIRSVAANLNLQGNQPNNIVCWNSIGAGNPVFFIYGWETGVARRWGRMYVSAAGELHIGAEQGSIVCDQDVKVLGSISMVDASTTAIEAENDSFLIAFFHTHSNTNWHAPYFYLRRSRGTNAVPTAVVDNDIIGAYDFIEYDGSDYVRGAQILVRADGVPTDVGNLVPMDMEFNTMNAAGAFATRLHIAAEGYISISNIRSGATQVAAGAAANELWKTNGHAHLDDNVVMIGV